MIGSLDRDEQAFVHDMAQQRLLTKTHSKRVSNYSEEKITIMGIAGEFCVAKALGCLFDPFPHRGGDHHRRDLWRGNVSISVKTRHKNLPAHFLYPTGQVPKHFRDNYAVVGRWIEPYRVLELVGYATRLDMERYIVQIPVSGTRSGHAESRLGLPEYRLRPIAKLADALSQIEDASVSLAQAQGYVRYFGNRSRSRGDTMDQRSGTPELAYRDR